MKSLKWGIAFPATVCKSSRKVRHRIAGKTGSSSMVPVDDLFRQLFENGPTARRRQHAQLGAGALGEIVGLLQRMLDGGAGRQQRQQRLALVVAGAGEHLLDTRRNTVGPGQQT